MVLKAQSIKTTVGAVVIPVKCLQAREKVLPPNALQLQCPSLSCFEAVVAVQVSCPSFHRTLTAITVPCLLIT